MHTNSTTAVVCPLRMLGIGATGYHGVPNSVFRCPAQSVAFVNAPWSCERPVNAHVINPFPQAVGVTETYGICPLFVGFGLPVEGERMRRKRFRKCSFDSPCLDTPRKQASPVCVSELLCPRR